MILAAVLGHQANGMLTTDRAIPARSRAMELAIAFGDCDEDPQVPILGRPSGLGTVDAAASRSGMILDFGGFNRPIAAAS